jgi:hypothetical protein
MRVSGSVRSVLKQSFYLPSPPSARTRLDRVSQRVGHRVWRVMVVKGVRVRRWLVCWRARRWTTDLTRVGCWLSADRPPQSITDRLIRIRLAIRVRCIAPPPYR